MAEQLVAVLVSRHNALAVHQIYDRAASTEEWRALKLSAPLIQRMMAYKQSN